MKKISNGNKNNEISINKIVNGPKEVMEAGDAVNAFIDVNEVNNLDASGPSNCAGATLQFNQAIWQIVNSALTIWGNFPRFLPLLWGWY